MKVTYRNRVFIDRYRCIDHEEALIATKTFRQGNILYCYIDRYNMKAISIEDIISIEEI